LTIQLSDRVIGATAAASKRLGARVRRLRCAAGLTQAQLALGAGLTVESVARIERCVRQCSSAQRNPCLSTLVGIADALGVHPAELLR
jgi:transcriptional regulator with XRE-family HTH domain